MENRTLIILAIDDSQDNLAVLNAVLSDRLPEAKLLTAQNGKDGINLALAQDPDVILLDIVMPKADGYSVCRELKADDRVNCIPVLFLTAIKTDRDSRVKGLEAGAEGFLAKPFDEVELIAQIHAMAKLKAANRLQENEKQHLAGLVAERTRELEHELEERRKTQAALQRSEEKYRQLIENAQEAIYVVQDGVFRLVNPMCCKMSGFTEAELCGKSIFEFMQNTEQERLRDHNEQTLRGDRQIEPFEIRIHLRSGIQKWLLINSVRIDWDGRPATLNLASDITERKRIEEELQESEQRVRAKLDAIMLPEGDIGSLELADMLNLRDIQSMMNRFFELTNIGVGILDIRGRILISTGWQEICTRFHRLHPESCKFCLESDTILTTDIEPGSFRLYRCKNNMWDIATPIMVGGKHLGNLFLGQFLFDDETPDYKLFAEQAARYGFNETEYLAALDRVPRWSREKVNSVMTFYSLFASMISGLSYANIKLARTLTERMRLDDELRISEENVRSIFNNVQDVFYEVTMDGLILNISPSIESVSRGQYRQSDIIGRSLLEFYTDSGAREHFLSLIYQQGSVTDYEVLIQNRDGTPTPCSISAKTQFDDNGTPVKIIGTMRNISERKQAEESLRESERRIKRLLEQQIVINQLALALGESPDLNEIYHTIHKYIQDLVDVWCFIVSSYTEEDKLIRAEYAAGDQLYDVSTFPPIPLNASGAGTQSRVIHTGQYLYAPDHQETIKNSQVKYTIEPDGTIHEESPSEHNLDKTTRSILYLPMKVKGKPIGIMQIQSCRLDAYTPDDIELLTGLANVAAVAVQNARLRKDLIHELVERKRSEEEREKLQNQMVQMQKMESIGRLAGGVAHDFNNMLGVIIGYAESAMISLKPDDPLKEDLKEILSAANRSTQITRQLLAFASKQTISPKVLALNEIVENMLKMLRRLIGEDICLTWHPGKRLWPVKVDPSQIDQILANLCVNARDAIAGTGKIQISTDNVSFDEASCAEHTDRLVGAYVRITVSDTGCGISPDILDKVFEPFFTTKGLCKGTGLGLATVYGIAKQNHGFVEVASEPGKGTTFEIFLPRADAVEGETDSEKTEKKRVDRSEIVLVVEDELAMMTMCRRMLVELGYRVITAASTSEAIKLCRDEGKAIHLLITDVIMPEMNGRELAIQLKLTRPKLRILFMSGYTTNVIAHMGILEPGVHFIQKPFSMQQLSKKVNDVLESSVSDDPI